MIYCDLTLSVCTGRNLSVRVDRSTEVVRRHKMPDASNYISVSVRGPPSFSLYENNERHKSTRGRCGLDLDDTDPLSRRPEQLSSLIWGASSSVLNYVRRYYEAVQGILKFLICIWLFSQWQGCLFSVSAFVCYRKPHWHVAQMIN